MLILLDSRIRGAHPPVACTIYISGGNAQTREPALTRSHRTEQAASEARVAVTVVHERLPCTPACAERGGLNPKKTKSGVPTAAVRSAPAALRASHSHHSSKHQHTLWLCVVHRNSARLGGSARRPPSRQFNQEMTNE